MGAQTAQVIRLEDYTAPAYRVEAVDLDIVLDPARTRVSASLRLIGQDTTPAGHPLVLDGDGLTLLSLSLNGKALPEQAYRLTGTTLEIASPPAGPFDLQITTEVNPDANTQLMGLYRSSGTYCTQCEADGFRRIMYFPDRPDVLAVYTTRIEAPLAGCPVLLANGNLKETGKLAGTDRHYAVWHDPHPKPTYLFALVAGDLACVADTFKTASGTPVDLNIYVEHGKEALCDWAMDSLKRSMRWDEEVFGREYDLEQFNIVAVSDFNMGAMENKGLNIFNDKYVLADPETATDQDYANIEAVIAHEYFHNWTGNRITCRDWFQLCLKEGLTVFRDQEFSADMRSRPVKRIADVKLLKMHQFPEDSGPLAHPVRPRSYSEINNFYTATVYEKGAEIIRMLKTLLGPDGFAAGLDLYFARHDGEATTIEAFLTCFEEAAGTDLTQFSRWYEQAGTPVVHVESEYDAPTGTLSVSLTQDIPPLASQKSARPAVIPLRFGLIGPDGKDLPFAEVEGATVRGDVLILDKAEQKAVFRDMAQPPVLSLLRDFSAPVRLVQSCPVDELVFRARKDSDPFNRWQAIQTLAMQLLVQRSTDSGPADTTGEDALAQVMSAILNDDHLDTALKAQALTLPSEADIAQELGKDIDPDAIHSAREALRGHIARSLADQLRPLAVSAGTEQNYFPDATSAGRRALANRALDYHARSGAQDAADTIYRCFERADNMTDRLAALTLLVHEAYDTEPAALESFARRHTSSSLAMDKWFMTQASAPRDDSLSTIKALQAHPLYDHTNPNRVRSVLQSFAAGNPTQFARPDGKGFQLVADAILEIDRRNPQIAARLLTSFRSWRAYETRRSTLAETSLLEISSCQQLSRDCRDIVDRTLQ